MLNLGHKNEFDKSYGVWGVRRSLPASAVLTVSPLSPGLMLIKRYKIHMCQK